MNDQVRREDAERLAESTAGSLDAARRWREIGEAVASSTSAQEAAEVLTRPPFGYSMDTAHRVLDMPIRRLTESGRRDLATRLEDLRAYLHDES